MKHEKPKPNGSIDNAEIKAKLKELVGKKMKLVQAHMDRLDRERAKLDKKALSSRDFLFGASIIAATIWHAAKPKEESPPSISSIEATAHQLFNLAFESLNFNEDRDLFELREESESVQADLDKLRTQDFIGPRDQKPKGSHRI